MRRTTTAVALTLALATAAVPAPAAAAARQLPNCATKRSTTLLATKDARVYADRSDRVFACRYRTNRRVRLGTRGDCQGSPEPGKFRLAGRYAGYTLTSCDLDTGEEAVAVADLITGRVKATGPAFVAEPGTPPGEREPNTGVTSLDITSKGSAVWIGIYDVAGERSLTSIDDPADQAQVRKLEAGAPAGSSTLVDSGRDIGLKSLALGGGGFYWRKGATSQFAPLR